MQSYLSNTSYHLMTSNQSEIKPWQIFWLCLLIAMAFFYGLGNYAIVDLNEGLYAEIAREIYYGNWLIPHLNFVPYLEKPPLLYWLIYISYQTFGINAFAARIVPALSATAVITTSLLFCNRLKLSQIGWLTAIILASSMGFIVISRVILFDMLLTFWITASLFTFYLWYEPKNQIELFYDQYFYKYSLLKSRYHHGPFPLLCAILFSYLHRRQ